MTRRCVQFGAAGATGGAGAAERFAGLFDPGSELPLPVNVTDDIATAVWEKLMINASINTIATVVRVFFFFFDPDVHRVLCALLAARHSAKTPQPSQPPSVCV